MAESCLCIHQSGRKKRIEKEDFVECSGSFFSSFFLFSFDTSPSLSPRPLLNCPPTMEIPTVDTSVFLKDRASQDPEIIDLCKKVFLSLHLFPSISTSSSASFIHRSSSFRLAISLFGHDTSFLFRGHFDMCSRQLKSLLTLAF